MEYLYGPNDCESLSDVVTYLTACESYINDPDPDINDRTVVALAARSVCSYLLLNVTQYKMPLNKMRDLVGGFPFLLDVELYAIPGVKIEYPMPRIPLRVRMTDVEDREDYHSIVDCSDRHGEAYQASAFIVDSIRSGKRVGVVTGKWRILNSGEVFMLRQCAANCDVLVVGVDDDSMCIVRGQDSDAPYTPWLDLRMSQLLELKLHKGRRIDYVYPVRRKHFWMYADDRVSPLYLPLLLPVKGKWIGEPELTENEYWEALYAIEHDPKSKVAVEIWIRKLIELGLLTESRLWAEPSPYRNLTLFLSTEPEAADIISARSFIYKMAGGRVHWIPSAIDTIVRASSTDIIRQLGLKRDAPWQQMGKEVLHPEQVHLEARARVKALTERALCGDVTPDTGFVTEDGPF